MKRMFRGVAILLILTLLLSSGAFAAPSSWAVEEVSGAIAAGLVPESLQQNYQDSTTRVAVARMFIDLLERVSGKTANRIMEEHGVSAQKSAFTDTEDESVLACNALGILKGKGNGKFDPYGPLRRGELAAVLNRVAGVLGVDTTGYTHSFEDTRGHWCDTELGWPAHMGIIKGKGNNRFDPDGTLTTQEAIAIVYRAYQKLSSSFEIYFLDVGQADSAVVICDGHAMLIDGGNVADSDLVFSFLRQHNLKHLDCVVATHAHEDHVGGIAGALNYATLDRAYCSVTSYSTAAFQNFKKYLGLQGKTITVPNPGETFFLGSARVTVLGPIQDSSDPNDCSIVLRIVYGDTSFLFTGDATRLEEADILEAGYTLKSTVLKVGHHGSETSTSYPFLREVMPAFAVISVGSGNSYGHPTEAVLSRLRDADVKVYRTDLQGQIHCVSDGETVTFDVSRNQDADTLVIPGGGTLQPDGEYYVLNTSTRKFHYGWCSSAGKIAEKNRATYTGSREDLISQGYSPCRICNP